MASKRAQKAKAAAPVAPAPQPSPAAAVPVRLMYNSVHAFEVSLQGDLPVSRALQLLRKDWIDFSQTSEFPFAPKNPEAFQFTYFGGTAVPPQALIANVAPAVWHVEYEVEPDVADKPLRAQHLAQTDALVAEVALLKERLGNLEQSARETEQRARDLERRDTERRAVLQNVIAQLATLF